MGVTIAGRQEGDKKKDRQEDDERENPHDGEGGYDGRRQAS